MSDERRWPRTNREALAQWEADAAELHHFAQLEAAARPSRTSYCQACHRPTTGTWCDRCLDDEARYFDE